jgi:RNA polymerase sigma-70 factor (ECF subfamily)
MASPTRFEALALPHMRGAFNLAYWILRSRADAEDVVQEAFLKGFRAFDDLRGDDIRPWLFAIVRNVALGVIGARRRATQVFVPDAAPAGHATPSHEVVDDRPNAEQAMVSAAERHLVQAALAELPLAYREVVALREIEGMGYREIAAITGTGMGTVMSRLSRGRRLLRITLSRRMQTDDTHGG